MNKPKITKVTGILTEVEETSYNSKSLGKVVPAFRLTVANLLTGEQVEYFASESVVRTERTIKVEDPNNEGQMVDSVETVVLAEEGNPVMVTVSHKVAGATEYEVKEGPQKGQVLTHESTGESAIKVKRLKDATFQSLLAMRR